MHTAAAPLRQGLFSRQCFRPIRRVVAPVLARRPVLAVSGGQKVMGSTLQEVPLLKKELAKLMDDYQSLARLLKNYPMFDIEGKKIYLEQMEAAVDGFHKLAPRLKSMFTDPVAMKIVPKELHSIKDNIVPMQEDVKRQISDLRRLLEEEEKIVDLNELVSFRQHLAGLVPWERISEIQANMNRENSDKHPSTFITLNTPRGQRALEDVAVYGPSALENYRDDPKLYKALKEILEIE